MITSTCFTGLQPCIVHGILYSQTVLYYSVVLSSCDLLAGMQTDIEYSVGYYNYTDIWTVSKARPPRDLDLKLNAAIHY